MSVNIIVNLDNMGIYNGIRSVLDTPVTDWSDHKNPDLKAVLMTPEHAAITVKTLNQLGYDNLEIRTTNDFQVGISKPNWWLIAGVAMLIGYCVASMFT